MPSTKEPTASTSVRKLRPTAKMPDAEDLASFPASDRQALKRRLSEPVECVFDPFFERPDAEAALFASESDRPVPDLAPGGSDDSGLDLLAETGGPTPSADQERHLFLKFNYCRHRVMDVLRRCRGRRMSADEAAELLHWERLTEDVRCQIVRLNLPLVLAMARRTKLVGVDYADLVSEGNLALLRSVDKFDCARGFKFSTYACRAILKSFSRVAVRSARYRGYFPTEFDPALEKSRHLEQRRRDVEQDCVDELRSILGKNLAKLNEVEQQVIRARFALDGEDGDPEARKVKTLEQVGEMIGVTKERVRQIQNRALDKLRVALEQGVLAV